MTTNKSQKIRIALFALGASALLAVTLVVFTGMHFWKDRTRYFILFDRSVFGLERGADVFYNGVRVGAVENLAVDKQDPKLVRVDIEVDATAPIPSDTTAVLRFAGITGLKVIDLHAGSPNVPLLAPGMRIEEGASVFDEFEERGRRMADQTEELMERANAILDQAETVATNLAALTEPAQLGSLVEQTKATAHNLAAASAALRGLVEDNRAGLKASVAAIEATAKKTADLVDGASLRTAIADLKQASRSFKELARDVRQKPSRLFFSSAAPDRKLP